LETEGLFLSSEVWYYAFSFFIGFPPYLWDDPVLSVNLKNRWFTTFLRARLLAFLFLIGVSPYLVFDRVVSMDFP